MHARQVELRCDDPWAQPATAGRAARATAAAAEEEEGWGGGCGGAGGLAWPASPTLAPGAWADVAVPPLPPAPPPPPQPQPPQPPPTPFAAWSNPFAATGAAAVAVPRASPHPAELGPQYSSLLGTPQRAPLLPSAPTPHAATPATVAAAADLRGSVSPQPQPQPHPQSPAAPPPPPPPAIVDAAGALPLGPGPWGGVVSVEAWLAAKLRPHQREGVAFLFRAVMGQAATQRT